MNKEEAADYLGITVRTLQRHMAAHRIGFEMRRTRTGEEAVFSREELERFKAEREALTTTVSPAVSLSEDVSPAPPQALQATFPPSEVIALGERLAGALERLQPPPVAQSNQSSVPVADKLTLSLTEAAQLS